MFTNPILGGNNTLIRTAIRSPNYVAGVSGWSINQDGSAEFNNIVVRGSVIAASGNIILDDSGLAVLGVDQGAYVTFNGFQLYNNSDGYLLINNDPTNGVGITFRPNIIGGTTHVDGYIYSGSFTNYVGSSNVPYLHFQCPGILSRATSNIYMVAEDSIGTPPRIDLRPTATGVVRVLDGAEFQVAGYATYLKPNGRIFLNGAQSIPNNAIQAISYTGTDFRDVGDFHNPASNADRITPSRAGTYRVAVFTCWAGFTGTTFAARTYVTLNGTAVGPAVIQPTSPSNGTQWSHGTTAMVACNGSTDYFGHAVLQASGGALNVNGSNSNTTTFQTLIEWEYVSN